MPDSKPRRQRKREAIARCEGLTPLELEVLDSVTRIIEREIKGAIEVADQILASHKRFMRQLRRVRSQTAARVV
jgi:hypothetical protein